MSTRSILTRSLASRYHFGQKYGELDYFTHHLCGVAQSLKNCNYSVDHVLVGYLHDILEDTDCREYEISDVAGFAVLDAVIALTKGYRGEESRRDYLKRVSKNEIARDVKMHDLSFNMLNCYKEGSFGRMNRYLADIRILTEFIKEETN